MKDLEFRRNKILELVINNYVDTAAPIASRTISRCSRLGLSPATVRNVMSDLEDMGFITHPHTSAGRIPTEEGYRYYINTLMQAKFLTEEEKNFIDKEFCSKTDELDEFFNKISKILSTITMCAGVVLMPVFSKSFFDSVDFISLSYGKVLVILSSNTGFSEHVVICPPFKTDNSELQRIANFLNTYMGKGSLKSIRREIVKRLLAERDAFFYVLEKSKMILELMLSLVKDNKVYLDGKLYLAEQPEFNNIQKLKKLFKVLEDETSLSLLLLKCMNEDGVKIYIGSELECNDFCECSMIGCSYFTNNVPSGTIAVIGPTRMEYSKLVSMVSYVASKLSKILAGQR